MSQDLEADGFVRVRGFVGEAERWALLAALGEPEGAGFGGVWPSRRSARGPCRRRVLGHTEDEASFPMRDVWNPDATWRQFIERMMAEHRPDALPTRPR